MENCAGAVPFTGASASPRLEAKLTPVSCHGGPGGGIVAVNP